MSMTSTAKGQLSKTIRDLRTRLLDTLHDETDRVYRMSVSVKDADLDARTRMRRERLEAWMAEQVRAQATTKGAKLRSADAFRLEAEKQAAYTLLNRLVMLRLMEASGLRAPKLVTGGWESRAYKDFRQVAQALVRGDETEGYAFLLNLVFEDLATDLPGLFGPAGVADLIPVPAATLRQVVTALDNAELESCWTDDMTLGWVYQYWNDPEREKLDEKINGGGKIEPHEIASKTQMFTERYMVDWLLQNSLNPMWLAMCQKHGWTPEVEADGTLKRLEERRIEWRAKREAGEVSLSELMPLYTPAERQWAYYMPQPIPENSVTHAPKTVRDLKLLDPAVGSGHFLVVAFDLLMALYREEARHRGEIGQEQWSDKAIVERIIEHNLNGIDIDPRAAQIAAAALWLKARQACPGATPRQLNLVAPNLRLASLPDDDPALIELRREIEQDTGIPARLTDTIVHALRGADHLGSLLRVGSAVEAALAQHEARVGNGLVVQKHLWEKSEAPSQQAISWQKARDTILERLETFLEKHSSEDDLGLRLLGEQFAAGVRFVRLVQEGTYDLVVGNPPYQGTAKMAEVKYVQLHYPKGKADLYAAFLERGLQLVRKHGVSALLTMRNWMFIKQYADLRAWLLQETDLRGLGDFAIGAFDEVHNDLLSVVVSVFHKSSPENLNSVALQPTPPDDRSYDRERTERKRAATLAQIGLIQFKINDFRGIPSSPLVYWWARNVSELYQKFPLLGDISPAKEGLGTRHDQRFIRNCWETRSSGLSLSGDISEECKWVPIVMGARGNAWFEPTSFAISWKHKALTLRAWIEFYRERAPGQYYKNDSYYFRKGIAYSTVGHLFSARVHRHPSVFGESGSSIFPEEVSNLVCVLNSRPARQILEALNPSISFKAGDLNRLPVWDVLDAKSIFETVEAEFGLAESHREPSVEFRRPGPSAWRYAMEWAQNAVDREEGTPLPSYEPILEDCPPAKYLSFALGVSLGRFGPNGEGVLDPAKDDMSHALPAGILFLDDTIDVEPSLDSLGHPNAAPLIAAWERYCVAISGKRKSLREWMAFDFFKDVHKGMYENRPIHWPLSSEKKTFVAWVNIHRWTENTLHILLADHLYPALTRLEGELLDLRAARDGADKQAARSAEKRYDKVFKAKDELVAFIGHVEQCADQGTPPTDAKCPPREKAARYAPDLDDGVMINSAALWPLLEPQWKDPQKWWKELASAQGKKDYDWSHLAMRYWPTRVDAKCQTDPSLGVAHGCFWRYHPDRAWAWELRLQHEIGPEFRIEEASYRGDGGDAEHRAAYLRDNPAEAVMAIEKEAMRRRGRGKAIKPVTSMRILEAGLWSTHPDLCWQAELSVTERQGVEFRLLAPDEPEARAAYEQAHPEKVLARGQMLQSLVPPPILFEDEAPDPDAEGDTEDAYEEIEA